MKKVVSNQNNERMFMHSFVTGEYAKNASMIPQWPGVELFFLHWNFRTLPFG